jgi:hypothetical protein
MKLTDLGVWAELLVGAGLTLILTVAVVTLTFIGIRCVHRHEDEPW